MVWSIHFLVTLWFEEHDRKEITKEIPQKYFLDLTQGVCENTFSIRQLGGGGGLSKGSKKLFPLFLRNFLFTLWKKIYRCLFSLRLCRKRISNSRLGGWLPAAGWYFLQFCGGETFYNSRKCKIFCRFSVLSKVLHTPLQFILHRLIWCFVAPPMDRGWMNRWWMNRVWINREGGL